MKTLLFTGLVLLLSGCLSKPVVVDVPKYDKTTGEHLEVLCMYNKLYVWDY